MPALFDRYVIVDWSAANNKNTGRDSIWICHVGPHGESCENPETRHRAKLFLGEILAAAAAENERVLLGFDFPFGYPAGFAARLGLQGTPWRALWDEVARLVKDDPTNRSNRFEVGAELNRRVSGGAFPFWGCPAGVADEFLRTNKLDRYAAEGLAEKRLIDEHMRGAQPCWKLAYPGSVGSQVLTGIPVVRALRDDPRWRDHARIWPFETGLRLRSDARIIFAEIWPSWWKARPELGPPNDKAQVRTVAAIVAAHDHGGELAALFAGNPNLGDEQRRIIESEEAWALGVTAPRRPMSPRNAPHPPASRVPLSPRLRGEGRGEAPRHDYLRDPAEITRRSFALVRKEADLGRFPHDLRGLALRLAHAAGDAAILADLSWSRDAVAAGRGALTRGAPILVDAEMVAAGVARDRLPAANPVLCTLRAPQVADLAKALGTTRSAAAVELWRPHLAGAVVAIGNAPTALFHLLDILAAGAPMPALVLGFPVGFVGAPEAKEALAGFGRDLAFVTLRGRRGGSALAAGAVNALTGGR